MFLGVSKSTEGSRINEDAHLVALDVKMTRDDDIARLAGMKTYQDLDTEVDIKFVVRDLGNGRSGTALGAQRKSEVRKWVIQSSQDQKHKLQLILGNKPY